MRAENVDILIFAVYCLCVAYTFYKMRHDVSHYFSIYFQEQALIAQLEDQNIQEIVAVQFRFSDRYKPEQLKDFILVIQNQSKTYSILLNWEQFVLVDMNGKTHRVIRLIPAMNLNLSQRQVQTIVVPQQRIEEKLTIEGTLDTKENSVLSVAKPLFDKKTVKIAAKEEKPFYLRLIVEITEPKVGGSPTTLHPINCEFVVKQTPWGRALRWERTKRKQAAKKRRAKAGNLIE
ncbi:MAG: hypothetical protein SAJ12_02945 [Jaaginema sp. PMC 1079.18]|nr:hypothetical protein [Jaaginema sp. PMC 1080.18]MEC4849944.1 hypothetical protein [Jaaginema sp. PMC 1079.18]MEC4865159.1 hypothetical protein [Jaaginema sp. PMC 1078.18]